MSDDKIQTVEDMVLYSVEEKIAYITFNRPKKLNAMDIDCLKRIVALLDKADKDSEVNVIVFRAIGRAFTAGYFIDFKNKNIDLKPDTKLHLAVNKLLCTKIEFVAKMLSHMQRFLLPTITTSPKKKQKGLFLKRRTRRCANS